MSIFYISQRLTLWYFVFLYLIFLSQQVFYFLLSTLVLTLYIDVVLSLSIEEKISTKISRSSSKAVGLRLAEWHKFTTLDIRYFSRTVEVRWCFVTFCLFGPLMNLWTVAYKSKHAKDVYKSIDVHKSRVTCDLGMRLVVYHILTVTQEIKNKITEIPKSLHPASYTH